MFKNGMDRLLTRDETPTSSWEVGLPDGCDNPDQAKELTMTLVHGWQN